MAAAEGLFKEVMTRSCRIFSTILLAVIFSLRSKPKFAKNAIKECEGGCDARLSCPICSLRIFDPSREDFHIRKVKRMSGKPILRRRRQ